MTIMKQEWSALPLPHAMEVPDRVPTARNFDPDFYRMETELLWPDSNYQRVIDEVLVVLPGEKLVPGLRKVNLNRLEEPVAEIEI